MGGAPVACFGNPVDYPVMFNPTSVTSGDFNRDGALDLVVSVDMDTILVFTGYGDGTFWSDFPPVVGTAVDFVTSADVNHDGVLDLIHTVPREGILQPSLGIRKGNGNGTFQAPNCPQLGGVLPYSIAIHDLNGDGHLDLAAISTYVIGVYLNNGEPAFQTQLVDTFSGGDDITIGDFSGDGIVDLAVVNPDPNQGIGVGVLPGNGDGSFRTRVLYPTDGPRHAIVSADFNRDGILDVVAVGSGRVSVFLGMGAQGLQAPIDFAGGVAREKVMTGDFNNDGLLDLVISTDNISLFVGNGDGTFKLPVYYASGLSPYAIASGDFDRDGRLDLAVGHYGAVTILFNQGCVVP